MGKYLKQARDPISSLTHAIGCGLGVIGLMLFIIKGIQLKIIATISFISVFIFGLSIIALYFASAYYHYVKADEVKLQKLRKFDHAMIFVLIAGTYTPLNFIALPTQEALVFTLLLWGIALFGMLFKLVYINAPRFLAALIYLAMGWAVLFKINAFMLIDPNCLSLVVWGGISYSVGAVVYALKKPNLSKQWGFHELFHIFIMIGTFLHYLAIYLYVL